ncbi:TerB family tellurite resistance protein [Chryseolinea sp. H1M3-3]|uniref:TerB family tellurite resistance protein n=1 Tax=Chryseolinea sp. H1M3-3 TaxID=3034144 RepID=UPI0023EB1EEF|nr:TerB family tellurite resistance protein [Chryseolinea sp. H1M3-3]
MRYAILITLLFLQVRIGNAQAQEAIQLALNYEKLKQLEQILDNMYKGYKILSAGYNRVKNIAEGNYKLHQVFLDGLFAVNPAVRNYKRVADIISYQQLLLKEYGRAYDRFKRDPNFSADELRYIANVYNYLVKQSLKNLEELAMIVTAAKLRMSDDERIQRIDRIYEDMEDKISFLRYFNNSTQMLAIQRAKENNDVSVLQKLYQVED